MENGRDTRYIYPGDIVLLVGRDHKEYIISVDAEREHQTNRGVLPHSNIIGRRWGETVETHLGYGYQLLPPSLEQLVRSIKRATQIIYPKDIGYLLMKMNIGPGTRVVEAGTGSGGLTIAMARMVLPHGHIYTYEARPDIQRVAQRNIAGLGLTAYVTSKVRDIEEGFDEVGVDALFLDVREPWYYLAQAHAALKGGGFFGCILPTTNQITVLLRHLPRYGYGFVQVEEIILRPYKAVADRFRPFDKIIAHTGYLIFARALLESEEEEVQVDEETPTQPLE